MSASESLPSTSSTTLLLPPSTVTPSFVATGVVFTAATVTLTVAAVELAAPSEIV